MVTKGEIKYNTHIRLGLFLKGAAGEGVDIY